jgi:UDP-GlcNAc3NAcA epimerase
MFSMDMQPFLSLQQGECSIIMKVATIIGARPQFIKAGPVSRILRKNHIEILVHTGQHYDENMSGIFFEELALPQPDYYLGIGSGSHGEQTGAMLAAVETVLLEEKPDWVLVYGDTNSTLAGGLAAAKLHIPVAHVEAGLRSYNRKMPEEINRILTDHLSDLLFCPSEPAKRNLAAEGITKGVYVVGDVMAEALAFAEKQSAARSSILKRLNLQEKNYLLVTLHRAENTDDPTRLGNIFHALEQIEEPIVFPVHPRSNNALSEAGLVPAKSENLILTGPLGYLDMVRLLGSARLLLTDSGGMQKESYWLGVPCLTLREETEWTETVDAGWNRLVGADVGRILRAVSDFTPPQARRPLYGTGSAAEMCVQLMENQR